MPSLRRFFGASVVLLFTEREKIWCHKRFGHGFFGCFFVLKLLPRAVNEPSEPSFWQNQLGSLVRKYIRVGPKLELS
jgi:hypothetical protein